MATQRWLMLATGLLSLSACLHAQEAVTGVSDPERLFVSRDPKLNANKQVAYHIVKDLIEAGHWEKADQYLTERYIQHNPLAASGRAGVVKFFTEVLKAQPERSGGNPEKRQRRDAGKPVPVPQKMKSSIVAVLAEGDLVTVVYVRKMQDSKDPTQSYTTTWFDMWRFKDGKADEHWDPATK